MLAPPKVRADEMRRRGGVRAVRVDGNVLRGQRVVRGDGAEAVRYELCQRGVCLEWRNRMLGVSAPSLDGGGDGIAAGDGVAEGVFCVHVGSEDVGEEGEVFGVERDAVVGEGLLYCDVVEGVRRWHGGRMDRWHGGTWGSGSRGCLPLSCAGGLATLHGLYTGLGD